MKNQKRIIAMALAIAMVGGIGIWATDSKLKANEEDGTAADIVSEAIEVPPVETEPAAEVVEEPVAEPVVEEPAVEEPAVEEPAAEESAVEEAVPAEETSEAAAEEEPVQASAEEVAIDTSNMKVEVQASVPDGAEVKAGTVITLKAILSGFEKVDYTLQWQRSTDGVNWENIQGATGINYSYTMQDDDQLQWRVVVMLEEA